MKIPFLWGQIINIEHIWSSFWYRIQVCFFFFFCHMTIQSILHIIMFSPNNNETKNETKLRDKSKLTISVVGIYFCFLFLCEWKNCYAISSSQNIFGFHLFLMVYSMILIAIFSLIVKTKENFASMNAFCPSKCEKQKMKGKTK